MGRIKKITNNKYFNAYVCNNTSLFFVCKDFFTVGVEGYEEQFKVASRSYAKTKAKKLNDIVKVFMNTPCDICTTEKVDFERKQCSCCGVEFSDWHGIY
jgi:hypothetical protein